jgi:hypothetical protein
LAIFGPGSASEKAAAAQAAAIEEKLRAIEDGVAKRVAEAEQAAHAKSEQMKATMMQDAWQREEEWKAKQDAAFQIRSDELEQKMSGSVRAVHCLQKLMGRPDSADLFEEFDLDGDGTVSLGFGRIVVSEIEAPTLSVNLV